MILDSIEHREVSERDGREREKASVLPRRRKRKTAARQNTFHAAKPAYERLEGINKEINVSIALSKHPDLIVIKYPLDA